MTHFIPPCNTYVLQDVTGASHIFDRHESQVFDASNFMRLVLRTEMEPFEWQPRSRRHVPTQLGKALDRLPCFAEIYSPFWSFEPQLLLLLDEYRKLALRLVDRPAPRKAAHEEFADFICHLRQSARVTNVRAKQADWESKYKKNASRLEALEEACFLTCPTVLLIHMPFRLKQGILLPNQIEGHMAEVRMASREHLRQFHEAGSLPFNNPPTCAVTYAELQADRQAFFANAKGRPKTFRHLLGYAWRMPYAPKAGYHIDAVFMFDGNKAGDPAALRDLIAQFWDDVTDGRGWACAPEFGASPLKPGASYDFINVFDFQKRQQLRRNVLRPMTRVEHVVAALPVGANVFGTSGLPTRKRRADHHGATEKPISEMILPQWNQGLGPDGNFPSGAVVGGRGDSRKALGAQQ